MLYQPEIKPTGTAEMGDSDSGDGDSGAVPVAKGPASPAETGAAAAVAEATPPAAPAPEEVSDHSDAGLQSKSINLFYSRERWSTVWIFFFCLILLSKRTLRLLVITTNKRA